MKDPFPGLRLADLTEKQREVLSLIADNRTSKEIAGFLAITESAVNQRIEAVRARLGGIPRAELARLYRQMDIAQLADTPPSATCNPLTADNFQLTHSPMTTDSSERNREVKPSPTAATQTERFAHFAPAPPRVVPLAFEGEHGTLNRLLAMIAVAVGLLALAMVCLGVAQALNRLV